MSIFLFFKVQIWFFVSNFSVWSWKIVKISVFRSNLSVLRFKKTALGIIVIELPHQIDWDIVTGHIEVYTVNIHDCNCMFGCRRSGWPTGGHQPPSLSYTSNHHSSFNSAITTLPTGYRKPSLPSQVTLSPSHTILFTHNWSNSIAIMICRFSQRCINLITSPTSRWVDTPVTVTCSVSTHVWS